MKVHFTGLMIALFVTCFSNQPVAANPTSADPSKPLATHNTFPGAAPLAEKLYGEFESLLAAIEKLENGVKAKGADSLSYKPLATLKSNINQSHRGSDRLTMMGEPAGYDLYLRFHVLAHRTNLLVLSFMNTRQGQVMTQKILTQLPRRAVATQRASEKVIAMASSQPAEAEAAADKMSIERDSWENFIPIDQRGAYTPPYAEAREAADRAMRPQRIADARKVFDEAIATNLPSINELNRWVDEVTGQLRVTGNASVEGKVDVGGVEVMEELSRRWGIGHAGLQRVQGLRWAIQSHANATSLTSGSSYPSSYSTSSQAAPSDDTSLEADAWTAAAVVAMAKIIAADTESITIEKVPAAHQRYLSAIAGIATLGSSDLIIAKTDEPLKRLAAKNPAYAESVSAYESATADVLEFDRRATQQASMTWTSTKSVDQFVREAARSVGVSPGLFPESSTVPLAATLSYPADETMRVIGARITDATSSSPPVMAENVIRIAPSSRSSAVTYAIRTYGTIPAVTCPEPWNRWNREQMLVSDAFQPLTITALHAVSNPAMGNYAMVIGPVVSAQLESLITRFAGMSDAGAIIVPRGTVPTSDTESSMMNQMVIRVDIDPMFMLTETAVINAPAK